MKYLVRALFLLLLPVCATANNYVTSFAVSENPISESGHWLNGGTCTGCGVGWNNIKTTGGYAQQAALGNTGLDDGTAVLTGTWGATQSVMITGKNPTSQGGTQEIEIRLRTTITPNSITGYEVDFINGSVDIVRWNGAAGSFTILTTSPSSITYSWLAHTNPILKATMVGSTITAYDCSTGTCTSLGTATDSTYTTGNPGFGIDVTIATTGTTDFGITNFAATDTGSVYNAADCNRSTVNGLIAGARTAINGDVILIPAGSCTWSSGITIPASIGIYIAGYGTPGNGSITVAPSSSCSSGTTITITGGVDKDHVVSLFDATPQFWNATSRISCMTIAYGSASSIFARVEGACTSSGCPNIRWDNLTFSNWTGHADNGISYGISVASDVFGVIDHNSLLGIDGQYSQLVEFQHPSYLGVGSYGDNSWALPESYGTSNFLFIENNTFRWSGCCENEGDAGGGVPKRGGGRVVVRYNEFLDSDTNNFSMGWHGTESNGRGRGARAYEYYGNDWNCNELCGQIAGGRSATGMVWGNTLFVCPNTSVCALNSFFTFTTYRAGLAFTPWGACDGSSVYDANDGVIYYSGTVSSGGGTLDINVSGSPGWMPNQWIPSGAPYSLHDVTQSNGTEITANGAASLTLLNSFNSSFRPADGDTIQVLRATSCIDQAGGRGAGQLYSSVDPATPLSSSGEVVSPSYLWSNNFTGRTTFQGGATFGVTSYTARVIRNRDFYSEDTNQGMQTTNAIPFNGGATGSGAAVGVGHGTLINRPIGCTAGAGYFAMNVGTAGTLYECVITNTWYPAYTPYPVYPHPLVSNPNDVTAPVAGNSGTVTTASVTSNSLTLNWTKATDAVSSQGALVYEICQSSSSVTTVIGCESALINSFLQDIATADIVNLSSGTTYHFNYVVMDEAGNKSLGTDKSQATSGGGGSNGLIRLVGPGGLVGRGGSIGGTGVK